LSRGGGSEEDLMPFNSEEIVRFIFASKIPIVTGIGHEDDNTLSDYVADKRGLTPTGAAQIITPDINDLKIEINRFSLNIQKSLKYYLEFKIPEIEKVKIRLQNIFPRKIEILIRNTDQIEFMLNDKLSNYIKTTINKLEVIKHSISVFNINEMSKKGYALVENNKKRIIKSIDQVEMGEKLKILLSDGILSSKVENKIKE
jgi:exodeoxyribonuclease VII large subunit